MPISATYELLKQVALVEFSDIVLEAVLLRHATGDVHKLRFELLDASIIDVFLSASGRYSYHWDRRPAGKNQVFRYDNAPHAAWQTIDTFPHHFHDGQESNVGASNLSRDPAEAVREFCAFARKKLLEEAFLQSEDK